MKPEKKPKILLTEREFCSIQINFKLKFTTSHVSGDGKIARLLRENNIRTMDIAKLMNISERSVTRLLAKFKSSADIVYEQDVVDTVEKMLSQNAGDDALEYTIETEVTDATEMEVDDGEIDNEEVTMPVKVEEEIEEEFIEELVEEETDPVQEDMSYEEVDVPNLGSKYKLFVSLLLMGTKVKDMAKMLDVSEKKVMRWKEKFLEHTKEEDEADDDDD